MVAEFRPTSKRLSNGKIPSNVNGSFPSTTFGNVSPVHPNTPQALVSTNAVIDNQEIKSHPARNAGTTRKPPKVIQRTRKVPMTCVRRVFMTNQPDHRHRRPQPRLSRVTSRTLFGPDLNKIAETIRRNQQAGRVDPSEPHEQIFIDDKGDILFGNQLEPSSASRLSRVTQETFYLTAAERFVKEREWVSTHMPNDTFHASDGEYEGWVFSITNEFDDTYKFFLWFDPKDGTYKTSLVAPELAGKVDIHACHLFADGMVCLKEDGGPGYPNMADTYARTALWARGASCYRRGYGFQLNLGQTG